MTAPRSAWEFSVVIPFFQRDRGLLREAVLSALRQDGVDCPRVIVVDDGSPVRADSELHDLVARYPRHLTVMRQENGGPGAARNTGIAHARADTRYIAFLDSDDRWTTNHLKMAKHAFDRGYDFYFCDAIHRDGGRTVLDTRPIPAEECRPIDGQDGLFEFTGDLFERFLIGRPMQTSGAVYRADVFPILFRTDLRTAAEDHFFWLEMASLGRRTAFSTAANVQLGEGVNIYNSVKWGTPEVLLRIFYDQLCMKDAARRWSSPRYGAAFRTIIQKYRRDFLDNILAACASARRSEAISIMRRYFALDPLAMLMLPLAVAGRAARRQA